MRQAQNRDTGGEQQRLQTRDVGDRAQASEADVKEQHGGEEPHREIAVDGSVRHQLEKSAGSAHCMPMNGMEKTSVTSSNSKRIGSLWK